MRIVSWITILILIPHRSLYLLRLEKCSNVPAFDRDFKQLMKFDKWFLILYHVFFVSLFFGLLFLGKGVA